MSKTLHFLGWLGLNKPEVSEAYLQPIGSSLDSEYVKNGSNLVRLLTGRRKGSVDCITPSTDFGPLTQEELMPLLEPLDVERLPALADLYEGLKSRPWDLTEEPRTVPLLWGDSPMVYDPRRESGVPSRYADLADPTWRGKVVVRNEMYCVLWMLSASLGHPDPARISLSQLHEVKQLARAIKENTVRVAGSYREMMEMLVAGEASVAVSGWQLMCHWAKVEHNVELCFATPSHDPKYWWADGYAILRDAPEKELAYSLVNHMLTPGANAALAWEMQSCSVTPRGYELMAPELREMYEPSLVASSDQDSGPLTTSLSYLPPLEREGEIAGDADWQAVWLDFLLS